MNYIKWKIYKRVDKGWSECDFKKSISKPLVVMQFSIVYKIFFYTPVFRRDVLWYGDVRPGLRPSVRHSFPHFSPTCFEILSWNFVYQFIMMHVRASSNAINFCQFLMELCPFLTSNCYKYAVFHTFLLHALTFWAEILHMPLVTVLQNKFECRQFPSIFVGVMPLLELRILKIHSFPHFSLTRFDILSWNFAFDFVLLYYRSSSSVVNFRQFL